MKYYAVQRTVSEFGPGVAFHVVEYNIRDEEDWEIVESFSTRELAESKADAMQKQAILNSRECATLHDRDTKEQIGPAFYGDTVENVEQQAQAWFDANGGRRTWKKGLSIRIRLCDKA